MAKPFEATELWVERIREQVEGLVYGAVNIIVHDGRIVQIERTDRKRFETHSRPASPQRKVSY